MATEAIAGYKGFISLSTATGQTKTRLAEITDWSLSITHDEIDATSHDSSGTRERIAGIDAWEGSGELLHVQTEDTHKDLFDVLVGKTFVDFEFAPTGSTADGTYSGTGYVTDFTVNSPGEDALNTSFSFIGSGVLSRNSSST